MTNKTDTTKNHLFRFKYYKLANPDFQRNITIIGRNISECENYITAREGRIVIDDMEHVAEINLLTQQSAQQFYHNARISMEPEVSKELNNGELVYE